MVYDLEPHPIPHSQPSASNITGNITVFLIQLLKCKKVGSYSTTVTHVCLHRASV